MMVAMPCSYIQTKIKLLSETFTVKSERYTQLYTDVYGINMSTLYVKVVY